MQAQSLLWKVTGNGLKSPSYIFGTHHLAPISILDSVPGFKAALNTSTQIVGEVDAAKMQSQECTQMVQKMMLINNDTTAYMIFNEKEQQVVSSFLKENMGFELNQMPKIKPAFISNTAIAITCAKMIPGFNPEQQLDSYIQSLGLQKGKKIIALESIDFQLNILFNSQSLIRQAQLLMCTLNHLDKLIADTKELNQAYFSFDLKKLVELSEKREGDSCDPLPSEMENLIKNRNQDWMTKLPAIMNTSPSFIAVGAMHLPGENGLIALFKKKGYKVEAVNK